MPVSGAIRIAVIGILNVLLLGAMLFPNLRSLPLGVYCMLLPIYTPLGIGFDLLVLACVGCFLNNPT